MSDDSWNRGVLFSIGPLWCEKILNGEKSLEIRKTRPKIEVPFTSYIYCTEGGDALALPHLNDLHYSIHRISNGYLGGRRMTARERERSNNTYANGKVVGEFVCDAIASYRPGTQFSPDKIPFSIRELGCMTAEQLWSYSGGKRVYGIHITDLKVYDEPKELVQFMRPGAERIEDMSDGLCQYCLDTDGGRLASYSTPNGTVMCEGKFCDSAYAAYLYDEFALVRPPQSWCYVEEMP